MGYSRLVFSVIGLVVHLWDFSAATRINLALSGTALQSSTAQGGEAERAIDGNSSPEYAHQSCTHTQEEKPWWRLQLPGVYRVSEIEVTNRNESRNRLNGVEILIGNSLVNNGNDNPRCAIIYDVPGSITQTVQCRGMEGRFINFYLSCATAEVISLCEVKVYGELLPPPPSITIQAEERNVTLVGKRLCWSDALFYCRAYYSDLLSIRGPEDQEMVDELVASAPFPLTSQLWVGLRRSITGTWFWMSRDPMDFTQWDIVSPHSSPCGGVSSLEPSTWRQSSCEEHLDFICVTGPTEGVNKVHFYSSTREKQTQCV
ncbi:uncharacterized protein LOC132450200 [Gadus macrocephalus]|uniref:uncharacterized protein LOC132450200 n=1 Tax=Gadus macrocephalus TaxID=80720 RepID=UPI0028CB6DF1|nr:uncharacterized protein LOC132450200 [Gadus macrocephalus]XP_059898224.1 uncharacterized protein LOC132450200 [Gadus macrocephalus]